MAASQNKDLQTGLEETLDKETLESQVESSSIDEEDKSSGISTWDGEEEIFGSVKKRPNQCKAGENTRSSGLVNTSLTEADATEICKNIGRDWKPLGRELGVHSVALDDISDNKSNHTNEDKAHALLIKFMQQHGSDATKGWLAEALFKIGRRDIAENLIGNGHFPSKSSHEQSFSLKVEGSLTFTDENDQVVKFFTCRNIQDGQLYLVRKLFGTKYEESCKALKQQDSIADSILSSLDVHGIVEEERRKNENQKFKESQEKITELLKKCKELSNRIENQGRNEKEVLQQLDEEKTSLAEMQRLGTGLLQLTGIVSHLKDPFPLQAQMYSFSLGLCAILRDLEERVKVLTEMAPSGETQRFEKVLSQCRNLRKVMQMKEKSFLKLCKEDALEGQQRPRDECSPSAPQPRTSGYPVDHVPEVRRASTQPVSEGELRALREQVAPPPDPLEHEEESSILYVNSDQEDNVK